MKTIKEAMTDTYRIQPEACHLTVKAFATGLLSVFAHSPTFFAREVSGEARFPPEAPGQALLGISVQAESLQLTDSVSPKDREDIEGRMRREVLDVAVYPIVSFIGSAVSGGKIDEKRFRALVEGNLTLHGASNPLRVEAQLLLGGDEVRLVGEFPLRLSEYGIRAVTAVAGTIRLKDQVSIYFDLTARKEAP